MPKKRLGEWPRELSAKILTRGCKPETGANVGCCVACPFPLAEVLIPHESPRHKPNVRTGAEPPPNVILERVGAKMGRKFKLFTLAGTMFIDFLLPNAMVKLLSQSLKVTNSFVGD